MIDALERYVETMNSYGLIGKFLGIMSFGFIALLILTPLLTLFDHFCHCL